MGRDKVGCNGGRPTEYTTLPGGGGTNPAEFHTIQSPLSFRALEYVWFWYLTATREILVGTWRFGIR